ncbi:uncharacterized protein Aud_006258 [Aspergillus udagawae]|uniref:Uncharacterized protein n=1 Tax=Aspergillus udagawae TaxID=91492 RepID=A0A8E0V1D7_9EURO|nr:uncharacterized protein Aud_006258 [Aspergillus udagawae]GIC89830.1 hypothetical protein Aud_006258 [Aspergillus udagawae]
MPINTPPDDAPPGPYHTCVNTHHAAYSENNLPPLLFRLEAPIFDDLPPLRNLVENGQVVKDRDGRPLRAFPFLHTSPSARRPGSSSTGCGQTHASHTAT